MASVVIYVAVFSNKRVMAQKKLWLITAKQCPDKQQVRALPGTG